MKKFSKVLGAIACAFVVLFSGVLLAACGAKKPYSVEGVTFKGTEECTVVWGADATEADKQHIWENMESSGDKEMIAKFAAQMADIVKEISLTFYEDGSFEYVNGSSTETCYYAQSEDLQIVELYHDAEHETDMDGLQVRFIDGKFYLRIMYMPTYHFDGVFFALEQI